MPAGFLLIDKDVDWTSFDVVAKLRGITKIRKIGHAGTLDPFATGLLIVAVGREATREIDTFAKQEKSYLAEITLGATTNTLDPEGELLLDPGAREIPKEEIERALEELVGESMQIPPIFSAIKKNGKKLYELARAGVDVTPEPRRIIIYSAVLETDPLYKDGLTTCKVQFTVSSGTYIRAIARDLGASLGTLGYLTALRRLSIGSRSVEDAHKLSELTEENWQTFLEN